MKVLEMMTKDDGRHSPDSSLADVGRHFLIGGAVSFTTRQPVTLRQLARYIAAPGLTHHQSGLVRSNVQRTMLLFSDTYRIRATLNESGKPIAQVSSCVEALG